MRIDAPESDYLYVSQSQIEGAGMGLFTAITIHKDEVICLYGGEIIGEAEAIKRVAEFQDKYFIAMPNGKYLDSINSNCFGRYANDADGKAPGTTKNNAKIALSDSGKVCLVALRKIKVGQEIFCAYGQAYWQKHG